jgi:uncharacterized damage-inducible protein DinB
MSERANELADRFERVHEEFVAVIEALSDADWRTRCEPEGWSVATTVRHVGSADARITDYIRNVAAGRPPAITRAQVDEINDREAIEHAACGKDEAIAVVRREGEAAARFIRALTDEQMARSGQVFLGRDWIARPEDIIEIVLIPHVREHTENIRAITTGQHAG